MGLAVLPARLKTEMAELAEAILSGRNIKEDEILLKHAEWVEEFLPKYKDISENTIHEILQKEIGLVFLQVLKDAGVYKRTEEGAEAFDRFLARLN